MASRNIGTVWDRGVGITNSSRDPTTNTILLVLGDEVGETTESPDAEQWQPSGIASRPAKPTKGSPSAQALLLRGSDRDAVIGVRDVRCQSVYASLDYGETCVYAPGENATAQGRILLKKDGSVNLYTRAGNTSSGGGIVIQADAENDAIRILNSQGYGIIIDSHGVRITAGGTKAALTIGSDGTATLVSTGQTQVDGATVMLGSVGAPGANSALHGPTGLSGAPSLKVIME